MAVQGPCWFRHLCALLSLIFTLQTLHPHGYGPARELAAAPPGPPPAASLARWLAPLADLLIRPAGAQSALLVSTPEFDLNDPELVAKAAELGNDPARLFRFVRDEIGYQAYPGSLRGARGTLWSGAGNALDRASLLVALLRIAGVPARYARGELGDAQARERLLSMFPDPERVIGCLGPGADLADPANDPALLAEARDHYWVQFDAGGGFQDADPGFPDAQPGQRFAAVQETFAQVPAALRHTVTVRLVRELSLQLTALFGAPSQDRGTVLERTFPTSELVGRPLSVGHFVNTVTQGFVIGATTTTYSPYLLIGGDDLDSRRDGLIRGQDYQEVLTNFPFGSQVLTGVFLELDVTDPAGRTQSFQRTLADRIGIAARETGSGGGLTLDPDHPALLTTLDLTTIQVLSSRYSPQAGQRLLGQLGVLEAEFASLGGRLPATPGPVDPQLAAESDQLLVRSLVAMGRSRLAQMALIADDTARRLAETALVTAYDAGPRIGLFQTRLEPGDGDSLRLRFDIDLRKNDLRAVVYPGQARSAALGFNLTRGFADTQIEALVMGAPQGAGALQTISVGAQSLFETVLAQNISVLALSAANRGELDALAIPAQAKVLIGRALDAGRLVLVPARSIVVDGRERVAWYESDPATGETIGVMDDGGHQTEGAITQALTWYAIIPAQFAAGFLTGAGLTSGLFAIGRFLFFSAVSFNSQGLPDYAQLFLEIKNWIGAIIAVAIQWAKGFGPTPFALGFVAGLLFAFKFSNDPPIDDLLLSPLPLDDFDSLNGPGLAADLVPDPLFTLPVNGAQVPTLFRVGLRNGSAAADTFQFIPGAAPAGFTLETSVARLGVAPGGRAEVGVCLRPSAGLPPPGTPAAFTVRVAGTDNPALSAELTENFVVPPIHGLIVTAEPAALAATPGTAVSTTLRLEATGNVTETVSFSLALPAGLGAAGLAPLTLGPGQTATRTLTLTPAPGTPLNTTLTATVSVAFGAPLPQTLTVPVRVAAPGGAGVARGAAAARALGNADLATRLDDLGTALNRLIQTPADPVARGLALAHLDSLIGLLANDPALAFFVAGLLGTRAALAAAPDAAAVQAAVNDLGATLDALGESGQALAQGNFEIRLLPSSRVAQPLSPSVFELRLRNLGSAATTYELALEGLPAGVDGQLGQNTVTLDPGQSSSGLSVTLTPTSSSELTPFGFAVSAHIAGRPELKRSAAGALTVRRETVSVTAVSAAPPFADPGATVAVSARLLNAVNKLQEARVGYTLKDAGGAVLFTSTPVATTLNVLTTLSTVDLGDLDTTGLAPGDYTLTVTVSDAGGTPIPGATGSGGLLIGSPVTATLTVDPDILPAGDGTVTHTLRLDSRANLVPPLGLVGQSAIAGAAGVAVRDDLAYVCGSAGISVVDISDPAQPTVLATFGPPSRGCLLHGDLLLATQGLSPSFTLHVYSVAADPLNPIALGNSGTVNYFVPFHLAAVGGHAYVAQSTFCFFLGSNDIFEQLGDLLTLPLNLDDPANPGSAAPALAHVLFNTHGDATFDPTDVSGCAENGGDGNIWQIAQAGPDTLLLATSTAVQSDTQNGQGRVLIVDIGNPDQPAVAGALAIPGTVHAIAVAVDGDRALVVGSTGGWNDFNADSLLTGDLTLTVLDVSDPRAPLILGSRSLERRSRTFWTSLAALGDGIYAFSNLGGVSESPQLLLINANDPANLVVSQTDLPSQFIGPNALRRKDDLLLATSEDDGLFIYQLDEIPGVPVEARVRVPAADGVTLVDGSFSTPPNQVIAAGAEQTLIWNLTFSSGDTGRTLTWRSLVTDLQPGESRPVTLGTDIAFTVSGGDGAFSLPATAVAGRQVLGIDPGTRTVRPGESAAYVLAIDNPAATAVRYRLAVQGVDPGWAQLPATVDLAAGAQAQVPLTLLSDPLAATGDYAFTVTAAGDGGVAAVGADLMLAGAPVLPDADPLARGLVMALLPERGSAGQGTEAFFTVRLTNVGSAADTFELDLSLPPGFSGRLDPARVTVPAGVDRFRDVALVISAPPGTAPADYGFTVSAARVGQQPLGLEIKTAAANGAAAAARASGTLAVSGRGVAVTLSPASGGPATVFQFQVTNTGQFQDSFELSLGGPAGLVASLGGTLLTLAPGASQSVPVVLGDTGFALPGSLDLVAVAASRAEPAVRDSARAQVAIAPAGGLTAVFEPPAQALDEPGTARFSLRIGNTGNTEDAYSVTISDLAGPLSAQLLGLDGQPAQTVPELRLPGPGSGALALDATLGGAGQGTVTVTVRSLNDPARTATASALLSTEGLVAPPRPTAIPTLGQWLQGLLALLLLALGLGTLRRRCGATAGRRLP